MRLALALSLIFSTLACNGGSSRYPKGKVCASSYDPLPITVADRQKLSLDPNEMVPGVYSYEGAEIYFQSADGVKIHRAEAFNTKAGEFSASMKCIAGLNPAFKMPTESIEAVKSLTVGATGKVTDGKSRVARVGFDQGQWVNPLFSDGAGFDLPSKVYDGAVNDGPAFYKMDPNNEASYQIRAKKIFADGSSLTMVVFLKRSNLP